ncbi:MAG: phosphatidylglycerophosphatase A [bacterium]|nr:phosphatidylglycerophosphatase A [bacterium]
MKIKEFLFTAFYSGYFPVAPGTAGTVVGMAIYVFEYLVFGSISWAVNAGVVLVMLYPAIKLGDSAEKFYGKKDPQEVVLDEVMGYWISVMFFPFNWTIAILAFILFRIFDILKPYPADKLQNLKGGLGIMIDDYIAGIYSALVLLVIVLVSNYLGMPIY